MIFFSVPLSKKLLSYTASIDTIMNTRVKAALNISHSWGTQSDLVFEALRVDFMKPVVKNVEKLLNETNIKVAVYNGQLDLIVDPIGRFKIFDL